jgi:hypothetical protein
MTLASSEPVSAVDDWVSKQLVTCTSRPVHKPLLVTQSDAASQAASELQTISQMKKRLEAFRQAAVERWVAAGQPEGLSPYLAEDKKELERRQEEIDRRVQRAAQLDPANEEIAYAAASAACRWKGSNILAANRRTVDVFTHFLDAFPHSKYATQATLHVANAYFNMAQYLTDSRYGSSQHVGVPSGQERTSLRAASWQGAVLFRIRYLAMRFQVMQKPHGVDRDLAEVLQRFEDEFDNYTATAVSDADFEEVAAEYAKKLDGYPELVCAADFRRLVYWAAKKNRTEFLDVLANMQKRVPDPKDAYWTIGKEKTLDKLCDLFEIDPRASAFHAWTQGKRGIGNLP